MHSMRNSASAWCGAGAAVATGPGGPGSAGSFGRRRPNTAGMVLTVMPAA